MPTRILLAPAAAGKTAAMIRLARERATALTGEVRVVVASPLQAASWQRRLAEAGGALGVRIMTFEGLTVSCLQDAGIAYTELSEPVQVRLIRGLLDRLDLHHYRPLLRRPGFVATLQQAFTELKRARITPRKLLAATEEMGGEPRLVELARIYEAYQSALIARAWTDRAGLLWLAADALEEDASTARDWPLLILDGFDQFDCAQLYLLKSLQERVAETVVTLTDGGPGYPRLIETRERLEQALAVTAKTLPGGAKARKHGSTGAQERRREESPASGVGGLVDYETVRLSFIEAPDRAGEVRAALRWLKERIVVEKIPVQQTALLARDMTPYRPFAVQIAAEFGLPLRPVDGFRLRDNPAIAALLDLLRLMLPATDDEAEPALTRRLVVAAWRSPYFNWDALPAPEATETIGIGPGDAERLDAASRFGLVLGGLKQWREGLARLATAGAGAADSALQDVDDAPPAGVPAGADAAALLVAFDRFLQRLTPPAGVNPVRDFVAWLERIIGPDLAATPTAEPDPMALDIVGQARAGEPDAAARDVAALQAFKEVLRGLVWAEASLGTAPVTFAGFFDELAGAIEAAGYQLPQTHGAPALLAADVVAARGLPFRAVALLGLAEGEFPAPQREDPFLRDADRAALTERGLALDPTAESNEAGFFYEAVHRAAEQLLLTRPRLEETGAEWLPSPYWESLRRQSGIEPRQIATDALPAPAEAASWVELLEILAGHEGASSLAAWVAKDEPERLADLHAAATVQFARQRQGDTPFDGDLRELAPELAHQFGPTHIWSPSRLERVHTCGYYFFITHVLNLAPRPEPVAGLEAVHLGSLYHQILEALYADGHAHNEEGEALARRVARIATPILDEAPQEVGFRETAWWRQTREEILVQVFQTAAALNALDDDFVPLALEASFGLNGRPALRLEADGDELLLRGFIDRVDRDPDGNLRVIDYKTAGTTDYNDKALAAGKRLQLPLYALAAERALGYGPVADGFYWHIRQAEPSKLRLAKYEEGVQAALDTAVDLTWAAVQQVRAGAFAPRPPAGGCPGYCPAAAFCRHYQERFA